ncbi:MAG TPA: SRPBCC family protein [Enhygromyxa sp.]|nr:SRPBCC family protein [Enhygromyxa sp.]
MASIVVTRLISAPVEAVFDAVAHIDRFSQVVPDIVRVEYVSEQKRGVGTRFRETRRMNGKEATVELAVTEYVENDRVRLVADSHGTVWDTLFTVAPSGGGTVLTMTMDAKAHKLLPKLLNPLIKGMVRKGVEQDMDAVKAFCERA